MIGREQVVLHCGLDLEGGRPCLELDDTVRAEERQIGKADGPPTVATVLLL
jgi:hypothetical protein